MVEDAVAAQLRDRLVDQLKRAGYIRSTRVEQAFRTVPRHLFVPPEVSVTEAYRDEVIPLLPGLATLSQPSIVALMLEELKAAPGSGTLEVGTASGYNAALLAEMVENQSLVHTIEIEPELARQAAENLSRAGYPGVRVRAGDGTLGWPGSARFGRVVITAEATDLSQGILSQIDEAGVLLTPFAIPGLPALLLRLRRRGGQMTGEFVGVPVAFVPLRGRFGVEAVGRREERRAERGAMWAIEHAVATQAFSLTLDQRLALGLVAVSLAEREGPDPMELAKSAWALFARAGRPALGDLGVSLVPTTDSCPDGLTLQRREITLCLRLPGQGNPVVESESQRQEDL